MEVAGVVVPYYQPIVRMGDQRIDGYEALARMEAPGGVVGPGEFLPAAEREGRLGEIGRSMLHAACRDAAGWGPTRDGHLPHVSVNVAPEQLRDGTLPDEVLGALEACDLDPTRLWLEITETQEIRDGHRARDAARQLTAVADVGVRVCLDDYGTGFSGVARLKHLPVSVVKVDRSYVSGVGVTRTDSVIVKAVIDLGHALDMTVVAEGVETEQQHDSLLALGADLGQGWYYGRDTPTAVH